MPIPCCCDTQRRYNDIMTKLITESSVLSSTIQKAIAESSSKMKELVDLAKAELSSDGDGGGGRGSSSSQGRRAWVPCMGMTTGSLDG